MGNEIENLSTAQIDAALVANGYTDNQLKEVFFRAYTVSGQATYEIHYTGGENDLDVGFVFVEFVKGVGYIADF